MSTPHDQLFRTLFSDPVHAASMLRGVLPPDLSAALALDRLSVVEGDFPRLGTAGRRADLVFQVPWLTDPLPPAHLVVLCEHQSRPDRWMALRLVEYAVGVWRAHLQEAKGAKRLPMVIPVVVHNGRRPWRGPRSLGDLQVGSRKLKQAARPHLFDGAFILDDLPKTTDADLRDRALSAATELTLRLLRDAHGDQDASLRGCKALMVQVEQSPSGVAALGAVIRYCLKVGRAPVRDTLVKEIIPMLNPDHEETYRTAADVLREEGIEQGLAQGRLSGRQELLLKMLQLKFGDASEATRAAVAAASIEALDAMAERILTATTIAEVVQAE